MSEQNSPTIINGDSNNNELIGTIGNDKISGQAGNDRLDGGAGNDYLDGGSGNDTYVFGRGYGNDEINNYSSSSSDIDQIDLSSVKSEDVRFEATTNHDLIIRIMDTNETLKVDQYFKGGYYSVDKIVFADKELSFNDLKTSYVRVEGTNEKDSLSVGVNATGIRVFGYAGDDTITNTTSNPYEIYGGDGNDVINGGSGNDSIYGQEGNDTLNGNSGNDGLYGGAGDDKLYGGAGNDYLDGQAGDDYLDGGAGNDTYVFGKGYGNDTIYNYSSSSSDIDEIVLKDLGRKDVTFYSNEQNDLIIKINETGETLNIQKYFNGGYYNVEKIKFADDVVLDFAGVKASNIIVEDTTDKNSLTVAVGGSDVTVFGHGGDDVLKGTTSGNYTMFGGEGNDTITGGSGADTLFGQVGNDKLYGGAGNDLIYGESGDDELQGQAGNDNLIGGEGNDKLYGGAGNDRLDGGQGNDFLDGGAGNDTYVFGRGYGNDEINNYSSSSSDVDQIDLSSVKLEDVRFEATLNHDLIIRIKDTNETLKVDQYFRGGYYAIDTIKFADKELSFNDVKSSYVLVEGTNDNDGLSVGIAATDIHVFGYEGDDVITNTTANPYTIYGGAGNDTINGGSGKDLISGDEGNDVLNGNSGDDKLYGGAGDDKLYGGAGNDYLNGGSGDDYLEGGAGNDIYVFGKGYGNDQIYNYSSSSSDIDEIVLEGLTQKDVTFYSNEQNDLIIKINETGETLNVLKYFNGGYYNVEKLKFADDTVLDFAGVKASHIIVEDTTKKDSLTVAVGGSDVTVFGHDGDDVLKGTTSGNYTIFGGIGNDTITGGSGADHLFGQHGNDKIYGGAGNDIIYGDELDGPDGEDYLDGGAGDDILNGGGGNDKLYGGTGNDYLDGYSGDDYLDGGAGNDTYYFTYGYGNDRINNYSSSSSDVDTIDLINLNAKDIRLSQSNNDLVITLFRTNETLTVENYFKGGYYAVEKIQFANGQIYDMNDVTRILYTTDADSVEMQGKTSITYANSLEGNDTVFGSSKIDIITGGAGDDYLDGGAGNDALEGGAGNDTYIFAKGYGVDYVQNGTSLAEDMDVLNLTDIKLSEVEFSIEGSDLKIGVTGTEDAVFVEDYFAGENFKVDEINFADGNKLTPDDINKLEFTIKGTNGDDNYIKTPEGLENAKIYGLEGNDVIRGNLKDNYIDGGTGDDRILARAGNDIVYGGAGNDELYGGEGNDKLYGGEGNDYLRGDIGSDYLNGGVGSDTYVFNLGDGQDTIYDMDTTAGNVDRIRLGDSAINMIFSKVGDDLVINDITNNDCITISDWSKGAEYQIEEITSADGMKLLNTQVDALIDAMSSFTTEQGMSWNDSVNADRESASALISQFWVSPTK